MPLSRTGILIGSIFVITIVMGDFVTIGVMGGQQIASIGKIIQVQTSYLQFPLAAANAVILLAVVLMIIWGLTRLVDIRQGALSMAIARSEPRTPGFWPLAIVFALFVLFLYGPMITIFVLSFQGPEGGLTFPLRGVSLHWFHKLAEGLGMVDIGAALPPLAGARRGGDGASPWCCRCWPGLAFRKKLAGGNALFFITVASLIMPSIIVSLGIGLQFRLLDTGIKGCSSAIGATGTLESYGTALGLFTSALGAHLTWTLPFGLLIMFAVFNRFNPAYEEAARDLGATPWQSFRHVVLPLIGPSIVGIGMFGFTLSWDEIARTSQAIGDVNTLPLELQGLTSTVTTPAIYALGTVTTAVSLLVIAIALGQRRLAARAARRPR